MAELLEKTGQKRRFVPAAQRVDVPRFVSSRRPEEVVDRNASCMGSATKTDLLVYHCCVSARVYGRARDETFLL